MLIFYTDIQYFTQTLTVRKSGCALCCACIYADYYVYCARAYKICLGLTFGRVSVSHDKTSRNKQK